MPPRTGIVFLSFYRCCTYQLAVAVMYGVMCIKAYTYQILRVKKEFAPLCYVPDGYRVHMMYQYLPQNIVSRYPEVTAVVTDYHIVPDTFPFCRIVKYLIENAVKAECFTSDCAAQL